MTTTYTISELSKEFSVTPRTIRYYEELGILEPERNGTNRIYRPHDRTALRLILRGKRLGLTINECKELIALYDISHEDSTSQIKRFVDMLNIREDILMQQQKDIKIALAEIKKHKDRCYKILNDK